MKVNVNKVNDKLNDIYSIHGHYKGGGRWPPPQKRCRGLTAATSSVVSFVVAMNRVDVVELVVDLVDVDLDVGLVDVDLDVDLVDIDLDVDLVDVRLVLKNAAGCTGQRLKRTSGA